jgi:hypothetical protein
MSHEARCVSTSGIETSVGSLRRPIGFDEPPFVNTNRK